MNNHKDRISEKFSQSAARYDQYADVQQYMMKELLARISQLEGRVLDLGSGTGLMADLLCKKYPKIEVVGLDLAPGMVREANSRFSCKRLKFLVGDGEAIPFEDNEFDAIISSASLQWMDPVKVFAEAARILKPGGELYLATFGPATLQELSGLGLSVNRFPGIDELEKQLSQYFGRVVVKSEILIREYESIFKLFEYLKKIGAQNPARVNRKGLLHPRRLAALLPPLKNLTATFEILRFHGSRLTK